MDTVDVFWRGMVLCMLLHAVRAVFGADFLLSESKELAENRYLEIVFGYGQHGNIPEVLMDAKGNFPMQMLAAATSSRISLLYQTFCGVVDRSDSNQWR